MKDRIAVLIPCYNESRTIEKVVRDFRRALPDAAIYVYDNNSSDGTGEIGIARRRRCAPRTHAGQRQRHPPDVP